MLTNIKEILNDIYLLFDLNNNIIGIYHQKYHKFIKYTATKYQIINNIIILNNDNSFLLYDPYHLKQFLKNNKLTLISTYQSLIFINSFFYDIVTGNLYEFKNSLFKANNNYLKITKDNNLLLFYNVKTKKFLGGNLTKIKGLYLLTNQTYYVDNGNIYQYSEFNIIKNNFKTILFTNDFEIIKEYNSSLKIKELNRQLINKFGIRTNSQIVYLINQKLYLFLNRTYPFKDNKTYPFVLLPMKIITSYQLKFGIGVIEADCYLELDYLIEQLDLIKEQLENNFKKTYLESDSLKAIYPKLLKK